MGWELPFALTGVLLAGLPVLVHLIRRRDLPVVTLPTLALLNRARVRSRRRLRLVDLLLLLCRALWIALLALAVAGPFVLAEVAWGEGRTTSVAIVIDDSMSMAHSDGGDTRLERARERASEVIEALPVGSEVALILAGHPVRVLAPRTTDLGSAASRLDTLPRRTARGTDLAEAVARATRELEGARHQERALVVLSDFAHHALGDEIRWPEAIQTSVERIGEAAPVPNRAISAAVAAPDPTQPEHASVRVTVRGFDAGDGPVELVMRQGGEEVARQRVSLADGLARAMLAAPLPRSGDPTAHVELAEHDALPLDDRHGVLLRSPNAVHVLVVDGDPHPSRLEDEVAFLTRALDVAPHEEGTVLYRTVNRDTVDARTLARMDLLVLANVPAPSPAMARTIHEFVERGGGLMVAPGDRADPHAYAARLDAVLPAHPEAVAGGPDAAGLSESEPSELVPKGAGGLAAVSTRRRWSLEPSRTGSRTLLRFGDGSPALVVGRFGEGRTALFATTLDDDWSDLPLRPGFVPLALRLVRGLAPGASLPERPFPPGEVVPIPVGRGVSHLRVMTPEGKRHDFRGPELGERVKFEHTERPGAYRVQVATRDGSLQDNPRAAFVVSPPISESDLSPGELPELGDGSASAGRISEGGTVQRSLAPWLFLAAGLFAILEAWLRRPRTLAGRGKTASSA